MEWVSVGVVVIVTIAMVWSTRTNNKTIMSLLEQLNAGKPKWIASKKDAKGNAADGSSELPVGTLELLMSALEEMGCSIQYAADGEESNKFFCAMYQGKMFNFTVSPDTMWVNVACLDIYRCQIDDMEVLCNVKKTVNNMNWYKSPISFMYQVDDEGMEAVVHMRLDFILHPSLPQPSALVKCLFDEMIAMANKYCVDMSKLEQTEEC